MVTHRDIGSGRKSAGSKISFGGVGFDDGGFDAIPTMTETNRAGEGDSSWESSGEDGVTARQSFKNGGSVEESEAADREMAAGEDPGEASLCRPCPSVLGATVITVDEK